MYNETNKKIILSSSIKGLNKAKSSGTLCLLHAKLFSTISNFLTECIHCTLNKDIENKLKKLLRDLQNNNPEICNIRFKELNSTFKYKNKNINNFFGEMAQYNITISEQNNLPPTQVGDGSRSTAHATTIIFNRDDFTTNTIPPYLDPEGDIASLLKIITLPTGGVLKLDGVDVIPNQIIDFSDIDLNKLTYDPDPLDSDARIEGFTFAIADAGSLNFTS